MDFYKGVIPVLGDEPEAMELAFPGRKGDWGSREKGYGYVPRDLATDPPSMFEPPSGIQIIPDSEHDARFEEEEATQSSLEHLYLRGGQPAFVNLDQNGDGYCWAYSTGHAIMMERLKQNAPAARLNPHAAAAIIKGGRDEGGWCGLSAKFARESGYAEEGTGPGQWPKQSRNTKYDTPELRASMAKYKTQEEWVDVSAPIYSQSMSRAMATTCQFLKLPMPRDFPWWSHSVCVIRRVRIEKGRWGDLILNSWLGWGRFGLGVLEGSKTNYDSTIAIRSSKAA